VVSGGENAEKEKRNPPSSTSLPFWIIKYFFLPYFFEKADEQECAEIKNNTNMKVRPCSTFVIPPYTHFNSILLLSFDL
jgi:hypothetical protein